MRKVDIYLLGKLEIKYNGVKLSGISYPKRSSKRWVLFTYLLLNRDRVVTKGELIDMLWPDEEVKNPANSLKILIFQLRRLIDDTGMVAGNEALLSVHTGYRLNPDLHIVLDIDIVDELAYKMSVSTSDDEKISIARQVDEYYSGNLYEGIMDTPWVASIQNKYISLYKKIISEGCTLLFDRGEYQEVISRCNKAIMIQAYSESFYYMMIKAYLALENYESANHIYSKLTEMLLTQYGEKPNQAFEMEFRELSKGNVKTNITFENMLALFDVDDSDDEGFYLSYNEFRVVYKAASRIKTERNKNHYVCMFTLAAKKGTRLREKEKDRLRRVLEDVIRRNLRKRDIFTRITLNQFVAFMAEMTKVQFETTVDKIIRDYDLNSGNENVGVLHNSTKITQK